MTSVLQICGADELESTDPAAACPAVSSSGISMVVSVESRLVFPNHRRSVIQYATDAAGETELRLFYGDKEITFDEPELFPFAETLARQAQFTAAAAAAWGTGYSWPRMQSILQDLVHGGVLLHAADVAPSRVAAEDDVRLSSLPRSTCVAARNWAECEAITQDIAGRSVELGYLELIVPIFRVAHIALDADQRQVGEANVFPRALRLDTPTEWRTCNLPGSRFQSERPMNVTAMRTMRVHWSQMMAALLCVRKGFLRRFPEADGAWTVGHVERLAVAVLAVPTYQLARQTNPVQNGQLHPALSSLFRVTDGVRMTTHQMLFVPIGEPAWSPDQPVAVDEILDYAERNYSFHSEHGVCAGPRAMVRELLSVLIEGRGDRDYASVRLEPAVQAAVDQLDTALDYGFYGLQAHAAVFSLWPAMSRAYQQLDDSLQAGPAIEAGPLADVANRLRTHCDTLASDTYLGQERWRAGREAAYADMYRECGRGISGRYDEPELAGLLAPAWSDASYALKDRLHDILLRRFAPSNRADSERLRRFSNVAMEFLLRQQAILRTSQATQAEINRLLGRDQPSRALDAADINVHNLLQGTNPKRLPYLIDELEQMLGVRIALDTHRLAISEHRATALVDLRNSAGMGPAV